MMCNFRNSGKAYSSYYKCDVCNWTFLSEKHLQRHFDTYQSDHFVFPCCRQVLKRESIILNHKCSVLIQSTAFHTLNPSPGKPSYKCENCTAVFSRRQSLKIHLRKYPKEHNFECEKCQKNFRTKSKLKAHLCILETNQKFLCSCDQYFTTLNSFKDHLGRMRPFVCCTCQKQCKTLTNLINHIRSHTHEKPFACDVCHKKFKVKETLVIHLRSHSGQKPYKCPSCSYYATTKWNLKLHSRVHDSINREKQFLCNECGRKFYTKEHLKRHSKTHDSTKSFLCKVCGKLISDGSYLSKHLKLHEDFQCPECNVKLEKCDWFKHHVETGHFKHVCALCEKVFLTKFNFERHLKIHEKKLNSIE